jgi:adenylate kinase family enzyme
MTTITEPALLAISGPIGSGKTTMTALLSQRLGWLRAAYGDLVRSVATSRGLAHDRPHLQHIGAELIATGWEPFTRNVLAQAGWQPGDAVIVDGVRHAGAVTALRQIATPLPTIVVYLDIPAHTGIARARQRDHCPTGPSSRDGLHPVEQDLPAVRVLADILLPAAGTAPAELAGHVMEYLNARHREQPGGHCA